MWAWASTKPGVTNLPWQSISCWPAAGRPAGSMARRGAPTPRISTMRSRSITMSTGPQGGAPVPSITVAPRSTRRSNGPSPRSRRVARASSVPPRSRSPAAISSPASTPGMLSCNAVAAVTRISSNIIRRSRMARAILSSEGAGRLGQSCAADSTFLLPGPRKRAVARSATGAGPAGRPVASCLLCGGTAARDGWSRRSRSPWRSAGCSCPRRPGRPWPAAAAPPPGAHAA